MIKHNCVTIKYDDWVNVNRYITDWLEDNVGPRYIGWTRDLTPGESHCDSAVEYYFHDDKMATLFCLKFMGQIFRD